MCTKLFAFALPRVLAVAAVVYGSSLQAALPPTWDSVTQALKRAVVFYHQKAASHGGYVYRYSTDFSLREAEGIPAPDTIWIQPPGTPAVGEAFLEVYLATGDAASLKAATDAAHALTRTQLASGGWDYSGHFNESTRATMLYRRDASGKLLDRTKAPSGEAGWHIWRERKYKDTNYSTLDDDVTQSAVRLLVKVDQALEFKDEEIHEAALYALDALVKAQYPCGAWSASFDVYPASPPAATRYPVKQASYPSAWSRTWPKDFTGCYVTNDNMHATLIRTLLLAGQAYKEPRYTDAAKRAGDFLLLARMPDPQPAWAQQYDANMQPVWSRAFEPPAISGRESQAVMWSLLTLTAATGEKKYLQPLPAAISYLGKSKLPEGKLARFYELQTNKPLYFKRGPGGKGHELTYDDDRTASNYGWKWDPELDGIQRTMQRLQVGGVPPGVYQLPPLTTPTDAEAGAILAAMNKDGAWAETKEERGIMRNAEGKKTSPPGGVVHSETLVKNVRQLCLWLKSKPR